MSSIRISSMFILLLCAVANYAQQGRGTILGTVTDSSGAAVRGAKVPIINVDTNNTIDAETNGDGFYTSPPLIVGKYQVTVEQSRLQKGRPLRHQPPGRPARGDQRPARGRQSWANRCRSRPKPRWSTRKTPPSAR